MKQFYTLIFSLVMTTLSFGQVIITEIADPVDNIDARFVEIYNIGTTGFDLTGYYMHDEEAKDNVDQLLKADLIITEQQLGYRWQSPDAGALQAALQIAGTNSTKEEENESEAKETEQRNDEDDEDGEEVEETIVAMKKKNQVSGNKIRAMMKLLAKEAGFLVNPDVEKAIAGLPDTDAEVARAESLLKTLGVKDEEKMRALVDYFFVNTGPGQLIREQRDDDMDIGIVEGEREQEVDLTPKDIPQLRELRDVISAEDVISAIKMYMEDMSEAPMGAPTTKSDGANKRRQQAMKAYWHNLTQVVSDDSVEIWKQLERDMEVCKDVLERRARSVARVDSLNEKNVKLKQLLNTYLGDVQNDRMQVPPAQLMHVRPIPGSKTSKMAATKLAKTKEVDRKAVGKLMSQTQ